MKYALTIAALLLATPAAAQDWRPLLTRLTDWTVTSANGCGRACETNTIRRARDVPREFAQNKPGHWINNADADVISSRLFTPPHGVSHIRGYVVDGLDYGNLGVRVTNYSGGQIVSREFERVGFRRGNGGVLTFNVNIPRITGQTGARGVKVELITTGQTGGRKENGYSFFMEYRADANCEPARRGQAVMSAPANRRSARRPSGIDRQTWQEMSQQERQDARAANNHDQKASKGKGRGGKGKGKR